MCSIWVCVHACILAYTRRRTLCALVCKQMNECMHAGSIPAGTALIIVVIFFLKPSDPAYGDWGRVCGTILLAHASMHFFLQMCVPVPAGTASLMIVSIFSLKSLNLTDETNMP